MAKPAWTCIRLVTLTPWLKSPCPSSVHAVPALDDACRVLRLLHVKDLRHLQSSIDDAIVSVQEFVANPRTDSTLGKIGI